MEQTLLDEQEIVKLLADTLEEEKQTDLKLTAVAEQHTMAEAMSGGIRSEEHTSELQSLV